MDDGKSSEAKPEAMNEISMTFGVGEDPRRPIENAIVAAQKRCPTLPEVPEPIWTGKAHELPREWLRMTGTFFHNALIGESHIFPVALGGSEADEKPATKGLELQENLLVTFNNGLCVQIKEGRGYICAGSLNYVAAACLRTATFPAKTARDALVYCALGLAGETGEYVEKIKKLVRGDEQASTSEAAEERIKELGDVLWYLLVSAHLQGCNGGGLAGAMIRKLNDRHARGVLKGSGDNR